MRFEDKQSQSRRSPGRPKATDELAQMDTEKLILYHAGNLFMKSGYAAVSINMITQAAGITKPTLYHYFPDKEHLYAAVICDRLEKVGEKIRRIIEGEGNVKERFFQLACDFFRYSPVAMSMFMRDVKEQLQPALMEKVCAAVDRHIVAPHLDLLREGMETGEIANQPEKIQFFAHLWLGMMDSMAFHVFRAGRSKEKILEIATMLVDVFFDGIGISRNN
jgi:AcrR family transcriptional regulator